MVDRPDAVLIAIPVLAVSGLGLQSLASLVGLGPALPIAALPTLGFVAAATLVVWELLCGPVPQRTTEA